MALGRGRSAAVVVVAVAVGAACGCASTTDAIPADDPVLALLDVAWSDPTSDVARMELAVATCMAEAGFTYLPTDDGGSPATGHVPEGTAYGITSGPHPQPPAADPNAAQVAALSTAEQADYWAALDGAGGEQADDGQWRYDWRGAGCRGWAQNQVYGDPTTLDAPAALAAELDRDRLAAESDPRLADLDAAWAQCMDAAGHPGFTAPGDAPAAIRAAWDSLWVGAWADLPADPSASDVAAAEAAVADATLALAVEETQLAAADRACRDAGGYDAARAVVTAEYQQRFYAAHRMALEELVATSAQAGG